MERKEKVNKLFNIILKDVYEYCVKNNLEIDELQIKIEDVLDEFGDVCLNATFSDGEIIEIL